MYGIGRMWRVWVYFGLEGEKGEGGWEGCYVGKNRITNCVELDRV